MEKSRVLHRGHSDNNINITFCDVGAYFFRGLYGGQLGGVILPINLEAIALIGSSCSSVVCTSISFLFLLRGQD